MMKLFLDLLLIQTLILIDQPKQGYCAMISCYDTDAGTCDADGLCYEIATHDDQTPENCIYIRGCIENLISFPNQDAINNLVKEPSGRFQVCASDKCNKKSPPCNPKNGNTKTAGATNTIAILGVFLFIVTALLVAAIIYIIWPKMKKPKPNQDVKAKLDSNKEKEEQNLVQMDANDGDAESGTTSVTTRSKVNKGHNTHSSGGMGPR